MEQQTELPVQEEKKDPPPRILSMEERNDLRKFVLSGGQLSLEQARNVYHTIREGQGAASIVGESAPKKKGSKKREALSDEALAADLDSLGI